MIVRSIRMNRIFLFHAFEADEWEKPAITQPGCVCVDFAVYADICESRERNLTLARSMFCFQIENGKHVDG